jgi:acetate kinase
MKVLAVNCGSSSVKYTLFDTGQDYRVLLKGLVERIGLQDSRFSQKGREEVDAKKSIPDHKSALKLIGKNLTAGFDAVGHRVVHGGESLRETTLIDKDVMKDIRQAAIFAPLHSKPNIEGIEYFMESFGHLPNVAVFDTAVHSTIPPKAYLYGLPINLCEDHGIRKYGFHGISHGYVARHAAEIIGKSLNDLKVITCHLGNGCSITAFRNGQSVDTSMGLTPLEGVMMGTRCGDIDPAIVLYLSNALGYASARIERLLNEDSGLKGLCGKSDMRDIIEMAESGDENAPMAIEVFVYRIRKYIGAYAAVLNGVDAIVFTGGIGENDPPLRKRILADFDYLHVVLNDDANERGDDLISADTSEVAVLVIPTDEERVIASETCAVVSHATIS